MRNRFVLLPLAAAALAVLGGCITVPQGPNVAVLPGSQKPWEAFRADDAECRQFAYNSIGGPAGEQAAANAAVGSAVAGTLIGAAAGLAFGGTGPAAAVGAGSGLLIGSAVGSNAYGYNYAYSQRRYDNAYVQCMYAKGNKVPMREAQYQGGYQGGPPAQYQGGYQGGPPPGYSNAPGYPPPAAY